LRHRHGAHPERQSQNNCQIPHGRPPSSATRVESESRGLGWQMVSERAAGSRPAPGAPASRRLSGPAGRLRQPKPRSIPVPITPS
jgi:hypothetical protein